MFNRINAVVLFVHDFPACLSFYRDTLGLPTAHLESDFAAFKMTGQDFAIQGLSQSATMVGIELAAFAPEQQRLSRTLLCVDVEDVNADYHRLLALGVRFARPPVDQSWGFRVAYFQDPAGNIWELRQQLS